MKTRQDRTTLATFYVDRAVLERLAPDDHSQIHAAVSLHRGGIVLKLSQTRHLMQDGKVEGKESPTVWDSPNLYMI